MSSINTHTVRRWHQLEHYPLWESVPTLPSWLTATVPANCTHTYAGFGNQYELNIGAGAAAGTEVKLESNVLRSQHCLRFEVDHWRHATNNAGEIDTEIYIAGSSVGFRLQHTAAAGKTQGIFTGQAAEDAVSIELVRNNVGNRVKCMGLEVWPGERLVHVLVDGEIQRTFETPAWPNNQTDLRAGIRLVKRGGGAQWMRYGGVRLSLEN